MSAFLVHQNQLAAVPKNNDKNIKDNNSISVNQTNTHRSWLITGFVVRLTPRVPVVKQELLTLAEHMSSPAVLSGVRVTQSLVVCVCFVDRCLSTIVLSVHLRLTDSDYPFGIFKLFLEQYLCHMLIKTTKWITSVYKSCFIIVTEVEFWMILLPILHLSSYYLLFFLN